MGADLVPGVPAGERYHTCVMGLRPSRRLPADEIFAPHRHRGDRHGHGPGRPPWTPSSERELWRRVIVVTNCGPSQWIYSWHRSARRRRPGARSARDGDGFSTTLAHSTSWAATTAPSAPFRTATPSRLSMQNVMTRDRAHACELQNGPAAMLGTSSLICNACFASCDHRFFSPITSTYSICRRYFLCAYC